MGEFPRKSRRLFTGGVQAQCRSATPAGREDPGEVARGRITRCEHARPASIVGSTTRRSCTQLHSQRILVVHSSLSTTLFMRSVIESSA